MLTLIYQVLMLIVRRYINRIFFRRIQIQNIRHNLFRRSRNQQRQLRNQQRQPKGRQRQLLNQQQCGTPTENQQQSVTLPQNRQRCGTLKHRFFHRSRIVIFFEITCSMLFCINWPFKSVETTVHNVKTLILTNMIHLIIYQL